MEFKPKYVRCTWSPELEGKEVSFSDSIDNLYQEVVNSKDNRTLCEKSKSIDYPFKCGIQNWRFVYYDPFFDLKLAHEQGKTIQVLQDNRWMDWYNPQWETSRSYRIKPVEETPVSRRELARWLAQGNGEYCWHDSEDGHISQCGIELRYYAENANEKVVQVKIRKWEDSEWHTPTREYMGLEE